MRSNTLWYPKASLKHSQYFLSSLSCSSYSGDPCVQEIGSQPLRAGRCVAHPNMYQSRLLPFQLCNPAKQGTSILSTEETYSRGCCRPPQLYPIFTCRHTRRNSFRIHGPYAVHRLGGSCATRCRRVGPSAAGTMGYDLRVRRSALPRTC